MSNTNQEFERAAKAFRKATGHLMPGKDVPAASWAGQESEDERQKLFKVWCAAIEYMKSEDA